MRFSRLVTAVLVLMPTLAWALDGVEPNAPIKCEGGEVFYPRGDGWAFLPQATGTAEDCRGALEPDADSTPAQNNKERLAKETDTKLDKFGHCLWVKLEKDVSGDAIKCSGANCDAVAPEAARQTVMASLRKWTGFVLGNATKGDNGVWYCPSTAGGTADTSSMLKSTIDYNRANAASPALGLTQPSFQFFRGDDVEPTVTVGANKLVNKGDKQKCYAPCLAGKACADAHPTRTDLFVCDSQGNTDSTKRVFLFEEVRNVVLWVKGRSSASSASWADLSYDPASLAVTETVFWPDSGVSITSDMMINNDNIKWTWNDFTVTPKKNYGCNPVDDPTCFNLETVVTHEAGHFIGLGHVECTGAVMFPEAAPQAKVFDLSIHERAGVCALYRPIASDPAIDPTKRYPTNGAPSRENEGCFTDAQCTTGKCLFPSTSFYRTPAELAAAPPSSRFAHRGVCVKPPGCANNDDQCEKALGRVCQAVTDNGDVSFCLPGSSFRPRPGQQIAQDICGGCSSAIDCQGVCVELGALVQRGSLSASEIPKEAPASICSTKCYPASGCAPNFTCLQYGDDKAACIPSNLTQCIDEARNIRRALNEACDQEHPCGPGLSCYGFASGAQVCLESCDYQTQCKTGGFRCALLTDDAGAITAQGVCFKQDMKEGDACVQPSSTTCGLACTTQQVPGTSIRVEVCGASRELACFGNASKNYLDAKCYALCSQQNACKGVGQKCDPIPNTQVGVCTPVAAGRCLKQTGEECSDNLECDANRCADFGTFKSCTGICDLGTRTGCPKETVCIDDGAGVGVCKPEDKPLQSVCGNLEGQACGACSSSNVTFFDVGLWALLGAWVFRKRVFPVLDQR